MKIVGPNLEIITKLAEQVRDQTNQVRGVADLGIFPILGRPNLNIKVDRAKAARNGLNSGDVSTAVQAAMGGAVATPVPEGDVADTLHAVEQDADALKAASASADAAKVTLDLTTAQVSSG